LDRQFKCDQPNHSWVSDMRSTASQDIRTLSGWYYLAAVMDLYSRKIVGFAMSHSATAELACQALQMAIAVRQPPAGLIIHSDQGCQYTSKIYQCQEYFVDRLWCGCHSRANCIVCWTMVK
jgi:putative transposase